MSKNMSTHLEALRSIVGDGVSDEQLHLVPGGGRLKRGDFLKVARSTKSRDSLPGEEWRDAVWMESGLRLHHQVSSLGRVFSYLSKRVYKYPCLTYAIAGRVRRTSLLVADAFLPVEHGKSYVLHINGDPYDNRLVNLRRCTQKEAYPLRKAYRHSAEALAKIKKAMGGFHHPKVRGYYEIEGKIFLTSTEAARQHGCFPAQVYRRCMLERDGWVYVAFGEGEKEVFYQKHREKIDGGVLSWDSREEYVKKYPLTMDEVFPGPPKVDDDLTDLL